MVTHKRLSALISIGLSVFICIYDRAAPFKSRQYGLCSDGTRLRIRRTRGSPVVKRQWSSQ
jgi:hypothetical protein